MQTITVEYAGEEYEFKPSFELYLRIEDKVSFNRLASYLEQAAGDDEAMLDLPMSQISWVMFCVLKHAGVAIKNPMAAHQALLSGDLSNYGEVLTSLIVSYYEAMPEKPVKKKSAKPKASPQ